MPAEAETARIVLLCAASGTGLTRIADWFDGHINELVVEDLERAVCERHGELIGKTGMRMGEVAVYPRHMLYTGWREACRKVLNTIVAAESPRPGLLSMHLTWYNPNTSEFYSPVDLFQLRRSNCAIVHVVILIDDIYDMYVQLTGHDDLYGHDFMGHERALLSNLAPRLDEHGHQLQAIELALGDLLSWRRAEMIQAENMAQSLGARMTILGTKHLRGALENILTDPDTPRVYLSHRITEHRKLNMENRPSDRPVGEWKPIVKEVNYLHQEFTKQGQVLINPTAIDELRFKLADNDGGRDPFLGARWPIPEPLDDLLCTIKPQTNGNERTKLQESNEATAYEHTRILTDGSPDSDPVSRSAARHVANRIYFEIAFRDHAIVENTPNLCVYRPFIPTDLRKAASQARWSNGVLREIEHWHESQQKYARNETAHDNTTESVSNDGDLRRIAFVHTADEIKGRLKWQLSRENRKDFLDDVKKSLERGWENLGLPEDEIRDLFAGRIPERPPVHLERHPPRSEVSKIPKEVLAAIRPAIQIELHRVFTSLERPGTGKSANTGPPIRAGQIALFKIKEKRRKAVDLDKLVTRLCKFYGTKGFKPDRVEKINRRFWRACDKCFRAVTKKDYEQYVAENLNVPYGKLQGLVNEKSRQSKKSS